MAASKLPHKIWIQASTPISESDGVVQQLVAAIAEIQRANISGAVLMTRLCLVYPSRADVQLAEIKCALRNNKTEVCQETQDSSVPQGGKQASNTCKNVPQGHQSKEGVSCCAESLLTTTLAMSWDLSNNQDSG